MNKKYWVILIILLILLGVTINFGSSRDFIGELSNSYSENSGESNGFSVYWKKEIPESKESIVNNCRGLDLEDTSRCFRDNVETFYKFNATDDDIELSFRELKFRGGDCRNYAFLYKELGELSGFEGDTFVYESRIKGIPSHRKAVVYNETHYCLIDQLKVNCNQRKL